VVLIGGLDVMEERKTSCLYQESNSGSSVVQHIAWSPYRLSYPGSSGYSYLLPSCIFLAVSSPVSRINSSFPQVDFSACYLFHAVFLFSLFSTPKREATCSPEKSVDFL
jgi:hypothetical protein